MQSATISVQFTGKETEYTYRTDKLLPAALIEVGDRVVVPGKIKDNGDLSLSIATVTRTSGITPLDDKTLPVVQHIPKAQINAIKAFVEAMPKVAA
jgi:hypothetical protein